MVEFAINDFAITEDRMNKLDFLIIGQVAMGRIYIRNPKDGVDWSVYIKPFKIRAWIGVVLFCVIVAVPMIVVKFGGRYHCNS